MEAYQQQKDLILQFFHEFIDLSKALGNMVLAQHLTQDAYRLKIGNLFVVVAGEFKQGKSSLLDAYLEEPALFPANPDIATCLVSTVQYAQQEKVTVTIDNAGQILAQEIQRQQISDYVTEKHNADNKRQARMLTIETPNPRLKDGLVFVDTPGTGGLFRNHSEITYTFLPNADAVLFVSDAISPLSTQDLAFVEKIAKQCQRIIFVVTKTDLSDEQDVENVIRGNRAKLSKVLSQPGEAICIVPVSSSYKLNYLQSNDSDDLADSNFLALEQALWQVLAKRGDIVLSRALAILEQALNELQAPLEAEMQALTHNPKTEQMKRQLQDARERIHSLESNKGEWRQQLQSSMHSLRSKINDQFQYNFLELRKHLDSYLNTPKLLKDPQTLMSTIEQDIFQIMADIDKELQEQIAEVHARIKKTTQLGIAIAAVTVTSYNKPDGLNLQQEKPTSKNVGGLNQLIETVSRGRPYSMAGSTVGLYAGGIIGGGLGLLTGNIGGAVLGAQIGATAGKHILGLIGFKAGAERGLSQMEEQELNETKRKISGQITIFIEESKLLCQRTISNALDAIESSMIQDFTRLLEEERKTCEGLLKTIAEAQQLSQEEAGKRRLQLVPTIQKVKQLRMRLQQLSQPSIVAAALTEDDRGEFADA